MPTSSSILAHAPMAANLSQPVSIWTSQPQTHTPVTLASATPDVNSVSTPVSTRSWMENIGLSWRVSGLTTSTLGPACQPHGKLVTPTRLLEKSNSLDTHSVFQHLSSEFSYIVLMVYLHVVLSAALIAFAYWLLHKCISDDMYISVL